MKLQHLIATGIVAIAAAGAGYYAYSRFLHPTLVTTSIASLAPVSEAVYGTGTVEPERWAKVVPLQRRRLVELCKCEGQVVKSGQILGRQDDAEERSALEQMEINRGQLERDLTRAEKDRDKNDATRTEYEQRWTKLEEAKSRIAAQKVRLDSLLLRAPLDGMVLRIGMSVETNIIFREKPAAIVVPAEAVAGDSVQMVDDGRIKRVPVTVGIRGSRNTEIIGDVSKGTTVLSPARRDLADGARIRIDNSLARAAEPPAASEPADQPAATPEATVVASVTTAPSDPDDAVISAAMTAHIDSVVSDARRNFISNSR